MDVPEDTLTKLVRQNQERMRDILDPPMLRVIRQQEALFRNTLDSPAIRAMLEQEEHLRASVGYSRMMEDLAASLPKMNGLVPLSLANESLAHSIFSSASLEAIRKLSGDYDANFRTLGYSIAEIMKQYEGFDPYADIRKFAETLKGLNLPDFYDRFKHLSELSLAAESILATVRWDSLGDLIGVIDPSELQLGTNRLNRSYAAFSASIAAAPDSVIEAPFIGELPTLSIYTHARAVRSITTHHHVEPIVGVWGEVQEETTGLIELTLPRVSASLLSAWKGGWATAQRKDADWVRQASSSFRYVLITTLDTIAPKDKVLADGVDRRHLTPRGEPTRLGRVHWLCRSIKNKTYRRVVFSDLESALDIIDAMSEAVHREEYPELEEAFGRMSVRAAVALRHLLELFKTRI